MIQLKNQTEKTQVIIFQAIKDLRIAETLRKSGIRKAQGHSTFEVFKFLLLLVFQGKNLFRFLDSERSDQAVSKNTYYRFLNCPTYNRRKFLTLLSAKVISSISRLTQPDRVNCLVLDDSPVARNRSKSVELLARVHDHSTKKYIKGFAMLALAWTDTYTTIPTGFEMLSSQNDSNRINDINSKIDKRTNGYKRRKDALSKKPEVALKLIQQAVSAGISADYVLMDTWFTHEPLIKGILDEGLDVIGMVKALKQKYFYQGNWYTMKELKRFIPKKSGSNILGSIVVHTKHGIPVKLVYVVNRNKRKEWLVILSTDLSISDNEIIRIYGSRWNIEVFFKSIKSFMKLGSEFQGRSYDLMISHTTIVFVRYILLEWLRREEQDVKTFGELFFQMCDDVRDIDFKTALQSLVSLFVDFTNIKDIIEVNSIKCQLQQWINQQASYIKALFVDLCWES